MGNKKHIKPDTLISELEEIKKVLKSLHEIELSVCFPRVDLWNLSATKTSIYDFFDEIPEEHRNQAALLLVGRPYSEIQKYSECSMPVSQLHYLLYEWMLKHPITMSHNIFVELVETHLHPKVSVNSAKYILSILGVIKINKDGVSLVPNNEYRLWRNDYIKRLHDAIKPFVNEAKQVRSSAISKHKSQD